MSLQMWSDAIHTEVAIRVPHVAEYTVVRATDRDSQVLMELDVVSAGVGDERDHEPEDSGQHGHEGDEVAERTCRTLVLKLIR